MPNDETLLEIVEKACEEVWPGGKVVVPRFATCAVLATWTVGEAVTAQLHVVGTEVPIIELACVMSNGRTRAEEGELPDGTTLPAFLHEAVLTLRKWAAGEAPCECDPERRVLEMARDNGGYIAFAFTDPLHKVAQDLAARGMLSEFGSALAAKWTLTAEGQASLGEPSSGVHLFEEPPIDITGGEDAADYVDALRGGDGDLWQRRARWLASKLAELVGDPEGIQTWDGPIEEEWLAQVEREVPE
jgi:hypothetical protein